jgi:hypothetical protein
VAVRCHCKSKVGEGKNGPALDDICSIQVFPQFSGELYNTGVGAGTAPYLTTSSTNLPAVKVMVASRATDRTEIGEFGILLDELMWRLQEWLRTDLAMLPQDAELIEELLAFGYEVRKVKVSSTDEIKDLLKRSPDRARSLMLTFMQSSLFTGMDLS